MDDHPEQIFSGASNEEDLAAFMENFEAEQNLKGNNESDDKLYSYMEHFDLASADIAFKEKEVLPPDQPPNVDSPPDVELDNCGTPSLSTCEGSEASGNNDSWNGDDHFFYEKVDLVCTRYNL